MNFSKYTHYRKPGSYTLYFREAKDQEKVCYQEPIALIGHDVVLTRGEIE